MSKEKPQTEKSKEERTDKFVWVEGDIIITKPSNQ